MWSGLEWGPGHATKGMAVNQSGSEELPPQQQGNAGQQESSDGVYGDSGYGEPDRLTRLWAPYRLDYIVKRGVHNSKPSRNPFVDLPKQSDEEALIIARGEWVYAVLNLFPYNPGHLMVVPYREVANLEDLTDEETAEMMRFAKHAVRTLKSVSRPHAVNVGFNLGKASGGSVADHLHMHVVPRWSGDSNFMTVIDGTKVLPQALRQTRELLADGWRALNQEDGAAC